MGGGSSPDLLGTEPPRYLRESSLEKRAFGLLGDQVQCPWVEGTIEGIVA